MKTIWLEGTKGEERERLKTYIQGNKNLLDILTKILYNMLRESEKTSIKDYELPSWPMYQAHLNGKKEVIHNLISLCDLDGKDISYEPQD